MTLPTGMAIDLGTLPSNGPGSIPSLRHWIEGFTLQTLVYGINVVLFLMTMWVLGIHILKASSDTHKFHKLHLLQNYILMVYTIVMFALSSIIMGRQGIMADEAWNSVFDREGPDGVAADILGDEATPRKVSNTVLILINWGTVGILMWRCAIYWKVRSSFPFKIMALPYLVFATSIATSLINLVQESLPSSMSDTTRTIDWRLISWGLSTGLFYLLSILISGRTIYHRDIMKKEVGDGVYVLAGNLTIFYESGAMLLIFATAYLVALARFPNLIYLFQALVTQVQVMTSLGVVQRVTGGKSWSGKIVDCVLIREQRTHKQERAAMKEEVSTMGFNPNTQLSYTQSRSQSQSQDDTSSDTQYDKVVQQQQQQQGGRQHDVSLELRVIGNRV